MNPGEKPWEESKIRAYLNNEFYNSFGQDKSRIEDTKVITGSNPWSNYGYGKKNVDTVNDKIFLLSIEEVVQYFGESGALKSRKELAGAIHDQFNAARIAKDEETGRARIWCLRSPGSSWPFACISYIGQLNIDGKGSSSETGIRPALWLDDIPHCK